MPIPKKQGHRERRKRVRPRRIEIHVNRKGACPPYRDHGKKRPALLHVSARQSKCQQQSGETVNRSPTGHGNAIWRGESVCSDLRTQSASSQNASVRRKQKWRPKD